MVSFRAKAQSAADPEPRGGMHYRLQAPPLGSRSPQLRCSDGNDSYGC